VDARRDRLLRRVPDRVAPFVAQAAGQVEVAEHAVPHFLDTFADACTRAALRAVLDDAVIFARGAHELPPFPPVVRAGLLDVNVLAGLAAPDGHQRVPM